MRKAGLIAGLLACLPMLTGAVGAPGPRHVPSPDWRDQIVYFVMIDRFDNGDPRNDDQHAGEFDPADGARYSGGDLAGVTRRLDYIRGLGATAVWITPPVAHQWWNRRANYGGYHGYWATDFSGVDVHFGTLADYRALADGLHARGMYLVQDVVVNHVADYFGYDAGRSPDDPTAGYRRTPDSRGRTAPTQPPFDLNDPRRARDRAAGIYHWTPDIRDYADPVQEKTWQMAGLDDLDTESAQVRRALRASYGDWIRRVGVDAFRIDTAFYVPPAFFDDFLRSADPRAPGILRVAAETGRTGFHVFGEGFAVDRAYEDTQARRIESYVRDADGHALLPGMINFPLYGTTLDVLARGRPTADLGDRIARMMRVHARPHLMPTFLDNHDVDRFLAAGSEASLRQGLLLMMTLPGIPTIYYGTEQGLTRQREAMFAGGYGSGGRDRFDPTSAGYRDLQRMTSLRRGDRTYSRGTPTVLRASEAGPGALVYRMDHEGAGRIVALNTADQPVLVDALDAGLEPGARLASAFAIEGEAPALQAGADGRVQLVLPSHAGYAWRIEPAPRRTSPPVAVQALTLTAAGTGAGGDLPLSGRASPGRAVRLVLDGDLASAPVVTAGRDGRWSARLPTADLVDPAVAHRVVAYDAASGAVSPAHMFHARPVWRRVADVDDPSGDDRGPAGTYSEPTDPGWTNRHLLDLERVQVWASGSTLRLDLGMRALSRAWNPANGFDHVAFTVYVELPDRGDGVHMMPLQDAGLPAGMRWHRRLRVGGWSSLLTASDGADATHEGAPVVPGAQLAVDAATNTVTLLLPARALGRPASLQGARVYVTTWDYDAGYRALGPVAGAHGFGGGTAGDPKVMDSALLELR